MGYTLPQNGVTSNEGITASGLTTVSQIDGGSMKLANLLVHDRFRRTVASNDINFPSLQVGVDGVNPSNITVPVVFSATWVNYGGWTRINLSGSHQRSVGDVIIISTHSPEGRNAFSVREVINPTALVISVTFSSEFSAYSTCGLSIVVENANGIITARPHNNLSHQKIHSVKSVRTRKVATAIRAGNWDPYSGEFSSAPALTNDVSSFGISGVVDDAVQSRIGNQKLKSEYAFREERGRVVTGDN